MTNPNQPSMPRPAPAHDTTAETTSLPPNVRAAHALEDLDQARELYNGWAGTYDEFALENGYNLPETVGQAWFRHHRPGDVPILDLGCGTGLVARGFPEGKHPPMHGFDLSRAMLDKAEKTGHYEKLIEGDATQPLDIPDNTYGAVVSAGALTMGHIGPEILPELLRVTQTGALFVLAVHAQHYDAADFATAIDSLTLTGAIDGLLTEQVAMYGKGHDEQRAYLLIFRNTEDAEISTPLA